MIRIASKSTVQMLVTNALLQTTGSVILDPCGNTLFRTITQCFDIENITIENLTVFFMNHEAQFSIKVLR